MKKILFVCLGNICRSPMAEYLFREEAKQQGLAVTISSAGTSGWHDGEYMHCSTADILNKKGIDSHDFVSKRVQSNAIHEYDYIIAMDDQNIADLEKQFGKSPKIFKMTDLLPEPRQYDHVPDPWFTHNFQETHDILQQCCSILANQLRQGER